MLSLASSLTSATTDQWDSSSANTTLSLGLSVLCDGTLYFDRSLCERSLPAASKRNYVPYLSPRRTWLASKQVPFVAIDIFWERSLTGQTHAPTLAPLRSCTVAIRRFTPTSSGLIRWVEVLRWPVYQHSTRRVIDGSVPSSHCSPLIRHTMPSKTSLYALIGCRYRLGVSRVYW